MRAATEGRERLGGRRQSAAGGVGDGRRRPRVARRGKLAYSWHVHAGVAAMCAALRGGVRCHTHGPADARGAAAGFARGIGLGGRRPRDGGRRPARGVRFRRWKSGAWQGGRSLVP